MNLEQKNIAYTKRISQRSTKPGKVVLDHFSGTSSVAKAGLLFPKRRRLFSCFVNWSCVTEVVSQLMIIYAREKWNKELDIDGEEQVSPCAKVHDEAVEAIEIVKRLDEWYVPGRHHPMQPFPPHTLYPLCTYFGRV